MISSPYFLILFWFLLVSIFAQYVQVTEKKRIMGRERTIVTWWFAVLIFLPLIVMAVTRGNHIGDTGMYISHYEDMPSNFGALSSYYQGLSKDRAYYMLAALIKCIFGGEYEIYFLIVAAIQAYGLVRMYRKYSPSYILAIFLFVVSTDYVSWMHNGTRQFVAVSITLFAADYMLEKKYIPAMIIVLIASRFHQSALLVLPMIFIVQGKPWNSRTIMFIVLILLALIFTNQFTDFLDEALEETQYTNVVTDWQSWNDDGTNPLRVLVYSMPAILSFAGLRIIRAENDPVINFATNMSIIAMGLYLVSMVTSGIFIGRLPVYASLYSQGILLPWEIDHLFNRASTRIVKIGMIVLYLAFYFYQMSKWGWL